MFPKLPGMMRPPARPPKTVDITTLPSQWKQMKQRNRRTTPTMERLEGAAAGAMKTHDRVLGMPEIDPDVKIYQSLSQQDLQQMTQEYGVDEVGRYVMAMESKKFGGR